MVQTTKGGVAPKKEKANAKTQANDKAAMDRMAESPGRSEVSDVPQRNQQGSDTPTTTDWAEEHPAGPAAPSEAYNSGQ
jgi:hypothetical protein